MQIWRHTLALMVLASSLLSEAALADFIQIDGFTPVIGSASRTDTLYPLPNSSTTTNGATFTESGGKALLTLGGNGNSEGAVELTYDFASPIDLTDVSSNDQFFLVMDSITRPNMPEGESTALRVSINVTGGGKTGTYSTSIGEVPNGQSLALNFYCDVNPVCFSQGEDPDFTSITQIRVWLAFPKNYAANDDITNVTMDSVYVTTGGGSFPPEFTTAPASATFTEGAAGGPVQFAASGVPEPDITLSGARPSGVTWDSTNHRLSGTPTAGTGGAYPLLVTASSSVGSVTRNFTLNVEAPPAITSSAATTFQQGLNGSFNVTASGYPAPTFSLSGTLPPGVTFSSSGVLSGTPSSSTGSYPLTITASNGVGSNANQAFTLTVNRPPSATSFSLTGQEDTPLTIPASAFSNAITELDEQAVSVVISSLPVGANAGTLKKANGSPVALGEAIPLNSLDYLTFEPASNWSGTTSFGWKATDGTLSSETTSAQLTFTAVNDDPVIAEGSTGNYATNEDNSLNVVLNVSDVDNTDLTTVITQQPLHGSLEVNGSTVIYTPELNYHGTDSYAVQVQDGVGGTAGHAFNVTVVSVNDLPAIEQGTAVNLTIDEDNTPIAFELQLNASDVEDGTANTLVWSLQTAATNGTATVTGTGPSPAIDYSPNDDYSGTDSFVARVTDSNGGHADFTVYLTITAFNDAPRIDGTPLATAVENVPWSFTPTITDPEAEPLTLSLTGKPGWASFDSNNGALTGTPSNSDVGSTANMTLTVDDGNSTATLNFSVTVLADFDGDTIPDVDDSDIDNDGMDNDFEEAAGLDPYDSSDASGDLDGDGISNLDEFNNHSDPAVDDYPPTLPTPPQTHADATGLFTLVDLGELLGQDGRDGPIPATPDSAYLMSGQSVISRAATDQAGNEANTNHVVFLNPQASFPQTLHSAEGDTLTITVYLSGRPLIYPVEIPFTLGGTADSADHNLVAGTVTIMTGTTGSIDVTFTDDGTGEGDETLRLVMGSPEYGRAVPGLYTQLDIVIHEDNVAPTARLVASQNGRPTRIVIADQGPVTVTAIVDDVNPAESLSTDWTGTDAELVDSDTSDNTFTFDPALLTAGPYTVSLAVSDGTLTDHTSLALNVLAEAPVLGSESSDADGWADDVEGFGDVNNDGVPDYLDANTRAMNMARIIQARPGISDQFLLETEPGLSLQLGATSLTLGEGAATLDIQSLIDTFNVSLPAGMHTHAATEAHDIIIDGLNPGASTVVIVPQSSPLPADARFIALANQTWTRVTTAQSAPGAEGYCPSPQDSRFVDGLGKGDYCVSLTVTDGGDHDADGTVNGRISLRGAVVSSASAASLEDYDPFASGSSNGGSPGSHLLLLLAALGLMRRRPAA